MDDENDLGSLQYQSVEPTHPPREFDKEMALPVDIQAFIAEHRANRPYCGAYWQGWYCGLPWGHATLIEENKARLPRHIACAIRHTVAYADWPTTEGRPASHGMEFHVDI